MPDARTVFDLILQHRFEAAVLSGLLSVGFLALWALLRWLSGARQPRPEEYVLRWHGVMEGLWAQPDEFYALLNTHLHQKVSQPESPFSKVKPFKRRLLERRSLSGALRGQQPIYLHTRYKHVSYYLSVAPTPIGLSISSWAFTSRSEGETLAEHDTGTLFSLLMHKTMQEVLSLLCKHQRITELTEEELAPIMRPFYAVSFSGREGGVASSSAIDPDVRRPNAVAASTLSGGKGASSVPRDPSSRACVVGVPRHGGSPSPSELPADTAGGQPATKIDDD